jgi:hypothetical protein
LHPLDNRLTFSLWQVAAVAAGFSVVQVAAAQVGLCTHQTFFYL